jgi:hypothetical protein
LSKIKDERQNYCKWLTNLQSPVHEACAHKECIRLFLEAKRDLLRDVTVLALNAEDARDMVQEEGVNPMRENRST